MKSFVFINYKGGVGKTTLAVNMAASLANRLKPNKEPNKVLFIDMDPNGSASRYFLGASFYKTAILQMKKYNTLGSLLKDSIKGNISSIQASDLLREDSESSGPIFGRYRAPEEDPFQFTSQLDTSKEFFWDNLHLLPSSPDLKEIVDTYPNQSQIPFGEKSIPSHTLLSNVLQDIQENYDYIVIDTPPGQGLLTLNAISFSKNILIPVVPDMLSVSSLPDLLSNLKDTKHFLGDDDISVISVIPSLYTNKYSLYATTIQSLKDELTLNLERDKRSILKRPFYFADKGFQRSSHLIELQAKGRPIFDLHKDELIRRRIEAIVDKVLELV